MEEKKSGLILIDTGVFLKYFLAEDGKEAAGRLLEKVVSREIKAIVSVSSLSELVTVCIRRKNENLIPTILSFIRQNFYVADTNSETAVLAGYFKAQYSTTKRNLSYVDSVILATAFLYGCALVTYDPEFKGVKEVKIKTPEEYMKQ